MRCCHVLSEWVLATTLDLCPQGYFLPRSAYLESCKVDAITCNGCRVGWEGGASTAAVGSCYYCMTSTTDRGCLLHVCLPASQLRWR